MAFILVSFAISLIKSIMTGLVFTHTNMLAHVSHSRSTNTVKYSAKNFGTIKIKYAYGNSVSNCMFLTIFELNQNLK